MKKIFRLVALAGAMVFAACSSDEITAPPKVVTPDMVNSYVNIRICTPGVGGTRAAGEGDGRYEYGKEEENAVKNYLLLFYDAQGNLVGSSNSGLGDDKPQQNNGQNVAVIKSGTAEVTLTEGANLPTQLVALVNPTEDMVSAAQTTNLEGLNEIVIGKGMDVGENIETLWNASNGFVMNSSAYYPEDSNDMIFAVNITEGMLYSSEKDAKEAFEKRESIVDVYIERLAVKGCVSITTTDFSAFLGNNVVDSEGISYELNFKYGNFDVTATAPASYYFKHNRSLSTLRGINNSDFVTWMNAYNDYRSYWAQSYYADSDNLPTTENDKNFPIVGEKDQSSYPLYYKSTNEVENKGNEVGTSVYFAENTLRASRLTSLEENPWTAATAFLLNGQYIVTPAEGSKGDASKYAEDFYLKANIDPTTGETIYMKKKLWLA